MLNKNQNIIHAYKMITYLDQINQVIIFYYDYIEFLVS